MSDNIKVLSGQNLQVFKNVYLCRYIKGEKKRSTNSGNEMIVGSAEIISPDQVPHPDRPDVLHTVGGRRFTSYFVIDPKSKGVEGALQTMKNIGLADDNLESLDLLDPGAVQPILERMNSGTHCFYAILDSEEDIARYPAKPGQRVGDPITHPVSGQPITRGWRIKMLDQSDYVSVAEAPADLPPVRPANAPY